MSHNTEHLKEEVKFRVREIERGGGRETKIQRGGEGEVEKEFGIKEVSREGTKEECRARGRKMERYIYAVLSG